MNGVLRAIRLAAGALLALSMVAGCMQRTFTAVNPRPNVVIEPELGRLALELGPVRDTQVPGEGVEVTQFRKTLQTGFRNMAGSNFTADAKQAQLVLRIEQAEMARANMGSLGGYVIIRYKAGWYGGDGEKLAVFAGVAEPRNPTEPGEGEPRPELERKGEHSVAQWRLLGMTGSTRFAAVSAIRRPVQLGHEQRPHQEPADPCHARAGRCA